MLLKINEFKKKLKISLNKKVEIGVHISPCRKSRPDQLRGILLFTPRILAMPPPPPEAFLLLATQRNRS